MTDWGEQARHVMRAARMGTLATIGPDGAPFASLVTPATAPDGSVLLLLSDLAEHTRHVRADPRCSLLVWGPATEPNPQTAPRVSISGVAAIEPDPALRARYVAIHPYAALYAGFGDFNLWRVRATAGAFVGGFARAARLAADQLAAPDWQAVSAACVVADADGYDVPDAGGTRRVVWPQSCPAQSMLQTWVSELGKNTTI